MNEFILDFKWQPIIIYFFRVKRSKNRIILAHNFNKFNKVTFIETIYIFSMTSKGQVFSLETSRHQVTVLKHVSKSVFLS